jgi:hypothetical protein
MRIETSTEPGNPDRPNEDFLAVALPAGNSGGSLVLLDGVTPPSDGAGCVHSVPWYVAALGGTMIELSVSRPDLALADCLAIAIERTAELHVHTCDLSHRLTPQATAVAVRWNADTVDHLVLSDSVLLLEGADGVVRPVLDDRLDRLRALGPITNAQRNADGGFFTAAADPGVTARAVTGSSPRADVRALAALTDGATRLVDGFGDDDWADTFALLRKQGPEELIRRVRAAESADPDGARFPRWKTHDDATAVLAELGQKPSWS